MNRRLRLGNEESQDITIESRVKQRCVLSLMLFNIYSEQIFEIGMSDTQRMTELTIVSNIRFADDTANSLYEFIMLMNT